MAQANPRKPNQRKDDKEGPIWSRRYWTGKGHMEVAVWSKMLAQEESDREVFAATLKKTYKDGDDYKESDSFFPEELPLASAALQEAFRFISETQHRQ